jgi:cytochrome c oxidase cbb3-type subunit 2
MTSRLIGPPSPRLRWASASALAAWGVALLIASSTATPTGSAQAPDLGTETQRESGKKLYGRYCSQCHGESGDGEGYATPHLSPKPRNFTTGKYKIRTTPTGALPTHQDLVNIIRRGMPYTSMPAWPTLTDQEVSDLAYFVASFSPEFAKAENIPKPVCSTARRCRGSATMP